MSFDNGSGIAYPTSDDLPNTPPLTDEMCAHLLAAATRLPEDIARILIDPDWRTT